jgi:hypothetical protein
MQQNIICIDKHWQAGKKECECEHAQPGLEAKENP